MCNPCELASWRKRVIAVTILFADAALAIMNSKFSSLILGYLYATLYRLVLGIEDLSHPRSPAFPDCPSVPIRNYVLTWSTWHGTTPLAFDLAPV